MSHKRRLTDAEEAGWRSTWDGWPLCPACVAKSEDRNNNPWPVPADYNYIGIAPGKKCTHCGAVS